MDNVSLPPLIDAFDISKIYLHSLNCERLKQKVRVYFFLLLNRKRRPIEQLK